MCSTLLTHPSRRPTPRPRNCPRCDGRSVQRWGRFSGRQRYRCLGCRRTFSTFTGTALYYLKRIDLWDDFRVTMRNCLTVRESAARIGVHRDTAFRWRHRLLAAVSGSESVMLCGNVAVGRTWFPYSTKGQSPPRGAPTPRPCDMPHWRRPRVWVVLATDEHGSAMSAVEGPTRSGAAFLTGALEGKVAPGSVLCSSRGPYSSVAACATRLGLNFFTLTRDAARDQRLEPPHLYAIRINRWLRRFRGVASRYLSHYLVWFRLSDTAWKGHREPQAHL